ncbi:hypothetical protein HY628_02005 [Candidatus Uhrbacteria bacterium]|nr:hypothetical protein [Candidatus Uhrbacteria bacterium]
MYLANFAIFVLGTAFFRQKYPALPALCIGLAGMAGIIMAIVPGSAQEAKWKRSMNAVSGSVLLALAFLRALAII